MLKQLQAGTGVVFCVFVAMHLVNTWLAAFGAPAYDNTQALLRAFYQFPVVEVMLLAALAVHVVVGVMRIVTEPKRQLSQRARWHRYAGFFLMVVIVGHILAVRGPSVFADIYPGFVGLAFSIDYAPLYFFPYYFLLALGGFYHAVNGLSIALPRLGLRLPVSVTLLKRTTLAASVATVAALLGFYGVWTDVSGAADSEFAQLAYRLLDEFAP